MEKFKVLILLVMTGAVTVYALTRSNVNVNHSDSYQVPDSLFHSGDLIFRDGRGAVSILFRNMSLTDQSYSHAGIIHIEKNAVYVYHIIGGEGNNSKMRKEKLSDFCNRNRAYAFGIYRTELNPSSIDSLANNYFSQGIRFDDKFDLSTDDKMYCTEMVYKVLKQVSQSDNFLPLTTVRGITYCACDNIFLSPHCKKIYSYNYK